MRPFMTLALVIASAFWTASPSTAQTVLPDTPQQLPSNTSIGPNDRIQVTVFREPELSVEDAPVDESGRVILPLVGAVTAAGKSTEALSTEIQTRLQTYLRNPKVTVAVKQVAGKRITVAGAVNQPGVFPIEGRTTLLQAVALAKGPSQVAALNQALIFRDRSGKRTAARFDLKAIAKGQAVDPEVLPGDTIAMGSSGFKTAWRDVVMTLRSVNVFSVIP
jgi:polysaccharide export outer membrane protein